MVPAPLLLPPARPQRRQPGGARRDRPGRRLLARARASPASASTRCRSCSSRWVCRSGAIADPHELLRDLRRYVSRRRGDAILLGEVNLPPDRAARVLRRRGRRRAAHGPQLPGQPGDVPGARARRRGARCARRCETLPEIPEDCQWANFVRNHDELTLDKLTEDERAEVFAAFGPEPEHPALRPRAAPAAADHARAATSARMRMVYSLAFSLPGTPVLFYGEEIGMAENLDIEGRYSVRAPMQWSAEPPRRLHHARTPSALCRPVVDGGASAPTRVNVAAPAPRPGLAAELDGAADPPPPRVPGARLGALHAARRRPAGGAGAPPGLGREHDPRAALLRRRAARGARRVGRRSRRPSTCSPARTSSRTRTAPSRVPLDPYGARWFRLRRDGQRLPPVAR